MKKDQKHAANAANDASTSREDRFIRAWCKLEHIEDSRLRLSTALRMYETEIIMDDWDEPTFAIDTQPGCRRLNFNGTDDY